MRGQDRNKPEGKGQSRHPSDTGTSSLVRTLVESLHKAQLGTGVRRVLWGLAVVVFVLAFVISLRAVPQVAVQLPWILFALAISPVILLLNGLEYCVAGRIIGQRIKLPEALRVSVLSSAANLLPLPGAVLVRSHALKRRGVKYRSGFAATVSIGLAWLTMSLFLAALMLAKSADFLPALAFSAGGAIAFLGTIALLRSLATRPASAVLMVLGLETLFVIVTGIRLYSALRAVAVSATIAQGIELTVAGAVASAIGLFPGGLGLREVLAGALGPVIGLPPAAGVLGAAVDRLIGLCILTTAATFFLVRSGRLEKTTGYSSVSASGPGEAQP